MFAAAAVKSLQSYPTLCDPRDSSPPGSPIPGILQARTLEWVAISFSNAWKWKVKVKSLSGVWLLATPWTAAYQAPPSMGFSRQEYWSGLPLPSPYNFFFFFNTYYGLSRWHSSKESVNARDKDVGLIPGLGRSPGAGNGNLLQYSCLGNSMDRGVWWAMGLQRVGHDWAHTDINIYTININNV